MRPLPLTPLNLSVMLAVHQVAERYRLPQKTIAGSLRSSFHSNGRDAGLALLATLAQAILPYFSLRATGAVS